MKEREKKNRRRVSEAVDAYAGTGGDTDPLGSYTGHPQDDANGLNDAGSGHYFGETSPIAPDAIDADLGTAPGSHGDAGIPGNPVSAGIPTVPGIGAIPDPPSLEGKRFRKIQLKGNGQVPVQDADDL